MSKQSTCWPWHLLTASILCLLALTFWYATTSTAYKWDWSNVNQYFYYYDETPIETSPYDAEVSNLEVQGRNTIVTLKSVENEELTKLTVPTDTLKVSNYQELSDGDTISAAVQWKAGPFLKGFWATIWISVVAGLLSILLGLIIGLCRISKNPTLRDLSTFYVELMRGLPLLVIIFIVYYFFGTVLNLSHEMAAIISLASCSGAYIAEIVRAGIQTVPKGQQEAARSLGMGATSTLVYIVLPQAFRNVLPALTGQFISLIKDTSLISAISITDLTRAAQLATTSSMKPFEMWFCAAGLYLVITIPLSILVHYLERRLKKSD